jgi:AcrR family transcriptional regulator
MAVRDRASREPRDRLADAAAHRFRRFGLRRTSVESITAAAGTGKGSLYLHFASKEALYLEVVRREVEEFLASASEAMAQAGDAPSRLRALVEVAIARYEGDDLLAAPLLDDRELLDPGAAALARRLQRERITGLIESTIVDGQRQGTIRSGLAPAPAAAVLFEIGWAVVRGHLTGELPLPLADALRTLNDIVGNGTVSRAPA